MIMEEWNIPTFNTFWNKIAAVSWQSNCIDVFGIGEDNGMFHKWWDGVQWLPSRYGWDNLSGAFIIPSQPVLAPQFSVNYNGGPLGFTVGGSGWVTGSQLSVVYNCKDANGLTTNSGDPVTIRVGIYGFIIVGPVILCPPAWLVRTRHFGGFGNWLSKRTGQDCHFYLFRGWYFRLVQSLHIYVSTFAILQRIE